MSQHVPQEILDRLAALEQQVRDHGAVSMRKGEEEWLQKIRQKSRLQGLGEAVPNPNLHAHLPYPAMRYHADGALQIVANAEEDARLGDGWYPTPDGWLTEKSPKKGTK